MIKLTLIGIILIKLTGPHAPEIDGVEQITHSIRVKCILIQYFFNHLLSMVTGPFVYDIKCLSVIEITSFRVCIIICICGLCKIRL